MEKLAARLWWGIPGSSLHISKTAVAAAADLRLPLPWMLDRSARQKHLPSQMWTGQKVPPVDCIMVPTLKALWTWTLSHAAISTQLLELVSDQPGPELTSICTIFTLVPCFEKPLALGSPKDVVFMPANETLILLHSQKVGGQRQRQGEPFKYLF